MEFISNFNGLELLFILILAILLFGPEKIPEIAAKLGSWARALRNFSTQAMASLREEAGLPDFNGEGDTLTSSLEQTAADLTSTVKTIQSPVQAIKESLNEEPESPDEPEQTIPGVKTDIGKEDSPSISKALLEKRLETLEQQLEEIRKQLKDTEAGSTEGMND